VLAGAGSAGHCGSAHRATVQDHFHFNCRIPSAVQNLTRLESANCAHDGSQRSSRPQADIVCRFSSNSTPSVPTTLGIRSRGDWSSEMKGENADRFRRCSLIGSPGPRASCPTVGGLVRISVPEPIGWRREAPGPACRRGPSTRSTRRGFRERMHGNRGLPDRNPLRHFPPAGSRAAGLGTGAARESSQ